MPKTHTKTTLPNGMSVLLKEIHTTPLISLWVWYRVGSRDEVPPLTGISHLVEHMQFKGTPRFPAELMDKAVAREGERETPSRTSIGPPTLRPCRPTRSIWRYSWKRTA